MGLRKEDYGHHSKLVSFVLTLNEAPDLSQRAPQETGTDYSAKTGSSIIPHLAHFYNNADFEDFYRDIIPKLDNEFEFLQSMLERSGIVEVIDEAWETDGTQRIEVIPMPLEGRCSGVGPSIGDTSYPVIGPPFDNGVLGLIAHEASHPLAKRALKPAEEAIRRRMDLIHIPIEDSRFPTEYYTWPTCFEEHFMRALDSGYIRPRLFSTDTDIDSLLEEQAERKGMILIRDFYDEIRRAKEKKLGLQQAALNIMDRLNRKYKEQLELPHIPGI